MQEIVVDEIIQSCVVSELGLLWTVSLGKTVRLGCDFSSLVKCLGLLSAETMWWIGSRPALEAPNPLPEIISKSPTHFGSRWGRWRSQRITHVARGEEDSVEEYRYTLHWENERNQTSKRVWFIFCRLRKSLSKCDLLEVFRCIGMVRKWNE